MKRTSLQILGIMIMIAATLIPNKIFALAGHTVSISSTNVTCNAACNGTATSSVSGGVGPFSYSWSPSGGTNATASGLCAGSYTLTVIDNSDMSSATATVLITQPPPLNVTASSTPVTCYNACDGTVSASVSGGNAPYTYLWSPTGVTTPTSNNLCAGNYTVTVSDANGCIGMGNTIVSSPSMNPIITMSDDTICVGATSQFTASATGAVSYTWVPSAGLSNPNISNPVASPIATTTYTLTVMNANGCTETTTTTLNVDNLNITFNPSSPTICAGGSVTVTPSSSSISNGVNYYWWSPLNYTSPNAILSPSSTSTYTMTATSTSGCTQTVNITVTVNPSPSVTVSPTFAGCSQSNGSAAATASGGTPPYLYQWSTTPAQNTATATGLAMGVYTLTLTDANGCSIGNVTTIGDSCGFVWPGDANEDLVADNNDILAIGLGYGNTGPARPNATINWIGQGATNWSFAPATVDLKYADCNGDGVIDNNDTTAVSVNYGYTHTYRLAAPEPVATNPDLYLVASADSVGPQTFVTIDVMMGTSAMPIDSIYGVAFTLSLDPTLIDSTMTSMSYSGSWLGASSVNMLPFSKAMHTAGIVDVAMVGTNHQSRSGYGKIATLRIVTTDNLSGLSVMPVNISNITAMRLSGNTLAVNALNESIVVDPARPASISDIDLENLVSIYPNPASSAATLVTPGSITKSIRIMDLAGRNIISIEEPSDITQVDLAKVPAGMYQVMIQTSKGTVYRKLNVIH